MQACWITRATLFSRVLFFFLAFLFAISFLCSFIRPYSLSLFISVFQMGTKPMLGAHLGLDWLNFASGWPATNLHANYIWKKREWSKKTEREEILFSTWWQMSSSSTSDFGLEIQFVTEPLHAYPSRGPSIIAPRRPWHFHATRTCFPPAPGISHQSVTELLNTD